MILSISSRNIRFIWVGMLVVLLAHAQAQGQAPDGVTITGRAARLHVSGPQPLAEALRQLSRAFKWHIGFEEAALRYSGDLIDMTSPKYVPKSKDDRAYFPRGGPLDIQFSVASETQQPSDPGAVIQALLSEYRARGYPARYSMSQQGAGGRDFYIFPDAVADEGGVLGKAEPVTNTRVSVVIRENEKLADVLQDVLTQMARTSGKRAGLGGIGANQFFGLASQRLSSTGEAASVFLNDFASALGANFWQVLYSPGLKLYILGFPDLGQP
jgi:hypothetical protein